MTERRPGPLALAAALLLLAAGRAIAQAPAAELPALFGRIVQSVGYTSDGPVDKDEVARLVSIKPGQALTEESTGSTIRHLFATRRFFDVRIEATSSDADVLVSSFQTGGSGNGGLIPMDSIALNYAKIEYEYKAQKPDGTLDGAIKAGFDLKKMTAV